MKYELLFVTFTEEKSILSKSFKASLGTLSICWISKSWLFSSFCAVRNSRNNCSLKWQNHWQERNTKDPCLNEADEFTLDCLSLFSQHEFYPGVEMEKDQK